LLTKILKRPISLSFLCIIVFILQSLTAKAQDTVSHKNPDPVIPDSVMTVDDENGPSTDTLTMSQDTVKTIAKKPPVKKSALKAKVDYSAKDSLSFDVRKKSVTMFNQADIKYQDIKLKAAFVEINFPENQLYAKGVPDSTGKDQGTPEFSQGDMSFKSKVIRYNYNSKQGYIQSVVTKQDEGYLHGTVVKKMENNITYLQDGTYTTCDLDEDPHFGFKFSKAKVIPGNRVITGPAYMMISGVPTPLAIPFGYFPNRTGRRSGILIPTYGESKNRGFYLQGLGYYFAMNEHMDLKVVGDIYTYGSWAIRPTYTYRSRYHFNGQFNFSYAVNLIGSYGTPTLQKSKDFNVRWNHVQDPKARPHSTFSANVNIVSNTYNKYNLASTPQSYLSNTFASSINYGTNFNNTYYLTINLSQSQNTLNKTISITLPQVAFWVNQFYPFRKKVRVGGMKWFENITTKYNLDMRNNYNTVDSLFLAPGWASKMENGIRHSIPISSTLRVLKFFNWTNSVNLSDLMYFQTYRMRFVNDTAGGKYKIDTLAGFKNAIYANYSSSINTTLYGMYMFKPGSPIVAIRHVVKPSVSFSYTPNFGAPWLGYWRFAENDSNKINPVKYSIFGNNIYGTPPQNKLGNINFAIVNNLEMKVRNRKDTVTGMKKIVLIENFTISTSYDIARDSMNWSRIFLSGYTTLFKDLRVNYSSTWDPYAKNVKGGSIKASEWKMNKRLLRLDNTTWSVSLRYTLSSDKLKGKKKTTTKGTPQEQQDIYDNYDEYVDFDIPWSFTLDYSFRTSTDWVDNYSHRVGQVVQTLGFSGQLNITPKWKITLLTGWDFIHSEISYTSINVYRDLHCWEMSFGWVPKGAQQNWNFSINVKAQVLQDLKLNKKKGVAEGY
jgi:lipopolysaccharide assembly outer membrane protein LptD (OstA)